MHSGEDENPKLPPFINSKSLLQADAGRLEKALKI